MTADPLAGVSPQTEQGERTSANPAEDAREDVCGFCGAPLDEFAEYVWDPYDRQQKWVCSDADACAERGRKK